MRPHKLAITFFEDEKARKSAEVEWTLAVLAEEILIDERADSGRPSCRG